MNQIRPCLSSITGRLSKGFVSLVKGQISHWLKQLSRRPDIQRRVMSAVILSGQSSGGLDIVYRSKDNLPQRTVLVMKFQCIGPKSIGQHDVAPGLIILSVDLDNLFLSLQIPCLRKLSGL